jgi:hypothetical protein
MKINCLTRDFFVPVTQRIKNKVKNENLNLALFIAHNELKNLVTSEAIIPELSKMVMELKTQCKILEGNKKRSRILK